MLDGVLDVLEAARVRGLRRRMLLGLRLTPLAMRLLLASRSSWRMALLLAVLRCLLVSLLLAILWRLCVALLSILLLRWGRIASSDVLAEHGSCFRALIPC